MIGHRLGRTVLLGLRSLALHKLRSVLTALGIIFGVSSVISMLSIGEGANYEAQEEIKKLGSQNVIVRAKKPAEEETMGYEAREVSAYGLLWLDQERIANTLPTVKKVIPMRFFPVEARHSKQHLDVQVVGTTPDYADVSNLRLARGRWFSWWDYDTFTSNCVMAGGAAKALFKVDDPLGEYVKLGSFYFRVVGVLEDAGGASGTGGSEASDRNRDVYVPLSTAEKRYGQLTVKISAGSQEREKVELHQLLCVLDSDAVIHPTALAVRGLLEKTHKKQDFEVIVPLELLEQKERTKRIFNVVLGSIAAISLLVGGIGIMNIMLANIVERTREIGVRRALGAKQRDILLQFLVETVVLSTTGGLLGVLLGIAIPYVVEAASGMRTVVTAYSVVISFGISALVGVIFGIYPAQRAAALDPIEALRRE